MAEPSTAWGREAVSDIRDLRSAVLGLDHRVESLERKMDTLSGDFRELRGEVRLFMRVVAGAVVVFGVAFLGAGAWVAKSVIELQVKVEQGAAAAAAPASPGQGRD